MGPLPLGTAIQCSQVSYEDFGCWGWGWGMRSLPVSSTSFKTVSRTPVETLRVQEQRSGRKGWKDRPARGKTVEPPYPLSISAQLLGTLAAPGRVHVLLLGSAGLGGGRDALDGRHRPGHSQQPLGGGAGDGTPQRDSFGASPRVQGSCTGVRMGMS